ncbi:uncharacterized protein FOMMEDRAFT_161386 [Fomitiporia mediterranea MF3/22]|uniref:uncharacterized protein n=1 Tax=Fomitiporia mediterranea (strain MF3/22) TaxID=694068 RepID=UPI0004408BC9|nr:uncharacterized protein FOMMEDRAFT_161386 [Fomitiporia mediterranea MF3/22]EJC98570.1 hypothetical protein FOMMEDRAFT_161386 [Fomitiporia mediterranea MF3/22]
MVYAYARKYTPVFSAKNLSYDTVRKRIRCRRIRKLRYGSLHIRFEQHGRTADLDEAIEILHGVLELRCNSDPYLFNSLGTCLETRFDRRGQTADLDKAIDYFRAALNILANNHPDRSVHLHNLAQSLATRYDHHSQTADLDEAIKNHQAALDLRPNCHPYRSVSLVADLEKAIKHARAALLLLPDSHPQRCTSLMTLGISLAIRFERRLGPAAELGEAIKHLRAALHLFPDDHPDRSIPLSNLAYSLRIQFIQYGKAADIDEAIELHCASLQQFPEGHHNRSGSLGNLACSLLSRFMKLGIIDDFEECMHLLERATEYEFSSLVKRLENAGVWACLALQHAHYSTSKAYKVVTSLLQRALIISPTLHAQHDFLKWNSNYKAIVLDAVAYAVHENKLEEAVELVEQGRGLLWSQMRGFRTPMEYLAEKNKAFADRFTETNQQLENLAMSSNVFQSNSSATGSVLSALNVRDEQKLFDESLKLKRQLSNEKEELVKEIRQIPGFEDFLTTTPFNILQQAASEGPIIVVYVCGYRSDALIVLSNKDTPVVCVQLDGQLTQLYKDSFELLVELWNTRVDSKVCSPEYDAVLRRVMKTLWDRVVSKVVTKLDELGIPKGSRIWWCPTSVLSAFPFHAAGPFEDPNGTTKYFLDDYVPSYTPTLGALINARSREPENIGNPAMLVIGDTVTLTSTGTEIREIRNNTGGFVSSHTELLNERATRDRVLKRLQKVTWVHFACHGHLGSGSLDSSFKLSDGGLTLLDILRANIPNAEFAFLSACHTAEQDPRALHDEVLHLAAAVQFCGFRSVIGTMWELYDPDGPLLAREIYSYMMQYKDGEVIHKRSAAALREAVLELRGQKGVETEQWVNLVHIGA